MGHASVVPAGMAEMCGKRVESHCCHCCPRCLRGASSVLGPWYTSPSGLLSTPAGEWEPARSEKRTCVRSKPRFVSRLHALPPCTILSSVQGLVYPFECVRSTSALVFLTDSRERWVFRIWKTAHRDAARSMAFLTRLETESLMTVLFFFHKDLIYLFETE